MTDIEYSNKYYCCCARSPAVVCRVWAEDHQRRMSRVAELQGRRDTEAEDTPEEIGTDDDDDDDDEEEEEEEERGSGRLVNGEEDLMGCMLVAILFLLHVFRVEDDHLEAGSGRLVKR